MLSGTSPSVTGQSPLSAGQGLGGRGGCVFRQGQAPGERRVALLGGQGPGFLLLPSGPWGPCPPQPGQEEAQCTHSGEDTGVQSPVSLMRN